MSMRGELVMRDRKLYVLYSTVDDNAPIRMLLYWRVHDVHRGRGFVGEFLGAGDAVTYAGDGTWSAVRWIEGERVDGWRQCGR